MVRKKWLQETLIVQYSEWLGNALTGDFGYSTHFKKPVNDVVWPKLWHTGILMFGF